MRSPTRLVPRTTTMNNKNRKKDLFFVAKNKSMKKDKNFDFRIGDLGLDEYAQLRSWIPIQSVSKIIKEHFKANMDQVFAKAVNDKLSLEIGHKINNHVKIKVHIKQDDE